MDNELLEIFTDQIQKDLPLIQEYLQYIQADKKNSTANLFRIFHNYKATSAYLGLNELHKLVAMGENILNSLRHSEEDVTNYDVQWLNSALSQLTIWHEQLISHQALSPADSSLFPTISILDDNQKTADTMQGLTLLYVDQSAKRSAAMQAPLSHVFKVVKTTDSIDELRSCLLNNSVDIIILNLVNSIDVALELIGLKPDVALVTAIPDLRPNQKSRLLLKGLTHPIPSPIQSKDLKRQLHNIVTSHFSKVYSLVSHQKIYNFIQGLDPLSSSVKKIVELCDDPDSSIKELIKTINSDAIITANILHAASLPIYGITKTSSLNQAVAAFGKRLIKAITLSDLAYKLGSLRLEAYNIDEETFKQTSSLRLALMNKWYSQIDDQALSVLSSSAILGNLGSILIDQELHAESMVSDFKTYNAEEVSKAEVTLLKTSTAFVTADILEFWGLEVDLVDSIRYSDSPFNASSNKINTLACANAIVYKVITPYGELVDEIPKEVKTILRKAKLDTETLEEALTQLKSQL
jgi:HD-like signal output (HDOD) protein